MFREQISPYDGGIQIWIHQIYVEKEFRKMGVLRRLFKSVLEKTKNMERTTKICLAVSDHNQAAREIYSKFGMKESEDMHPWLNFE